MNILIVDDEANIRKTLGLYLKAAGHVSAAVSNTNEAARINRKNSSMRFFSTCGSALKTAST